MTEPGLLASLRGQQYIVLRPTVAVAAFYESEQSKLLTRLPGSTPHPNTGHVTLRGLYEPDRVHVVRDLIESWADAMTPIDLIVDAIDGFPPPFAVLIARLARTKSLTEAYSSLTELLDATDVRRIGELPLDDWVFHLSIAYASALDEQEWHDVLAASARAVTSSPREHVSSVDFVWYDDDGEHIDSFALRSS
jgi:hypothetical protein